LQVNFGVVWGSTSYLWYAVFIAGAEDKKQHRVSWSLCSELGHCYVCLDYVKQRTYLSKVKVIRAVTSLYLRRSTAQWQEEEAEYIILLQGEARN
jgi:hypothetical protein